MTSQAVENGLSSEVRRRLYRDVEALVALDRRTTSVGERTSAAIIGSRLADAGCEGVSTEEFRGISSWVPPHLAYVVAGLAVSLSGRRWARVAALAIAGSYELEASSRNQWIRQLLPHGTGASVTAKLPAVGSQRRRVVLVAHHDTAQTGLVWKRQAIALSHSCARHTGRALPSHLTVLLGILSAAATRKTSRRIGRWVLAASGALMAEAMRSPSTPGANDNASGVASIIEVARRPAVDPPAGVEILVVIPGGEEVGHAGWRAWIQENIDRLDPDRTLVINLDAVGSKGSLAVSTCEGLSTRMRTADVEFALDLAKEKEIDARPLGLPNPTDAVLAAHAGLPTVSLLSEQEGWISNLHQSSDTIDNVDWSTVEDAVVLTEALARSYGEEKGTVNA